ncbi:RteC domain-containing protein [Flavobacterium sp.]|uniref:RteC domain-containing protein n=1 Tax=Flavobacterium sp. TaxID=239 RepID=UPI00286AD698|nr:RteC domain-containing protein [Flavobacterium sp.]
MSIKVFYSFKEYESEYENLLEAFLIDYIDNTEEDFISEQLEFYSICLDNVVFTEVCKGNDDITWSEFYIKAEAETQNVIKEIARKILTLEREENSLYNNYDPNVNVELCKQYERSFIKIKDFLLIKSKKEMKINIIYSAQEYSNEYEILKSQYFSKFKEVEEIDFINTEIENYKLYSKIVKLPIDRVFNRLWNIDIGTDLKTFSITQELKDFVMENHKAYCKLYYDIVDKNRLTNINSDVEIEQSRLIFPKIISFLENKKSEIENQPKINSQISMNDIKTLNWQGTELEFTELIKALRLSNKLNPEVNQIETFARLKLFFNLPEFNENDKLKEVRNRTKTLTPFLNTLEISLSNWIKSKD